MIPAFGASGLCKTYGEREVVVGVDIAVGHGEIVGLLGPSGSGKSTIFKILTGIVKANSGTVFLGERNITSAGIDVRARMGLGYVPQASVLFTNLTTEDNLRIAIEAKNLNQAGAERFLSTVCGAFGLIDIRHRRLGELSGGQRRLVEIAFAICSKPKFLLLDEPFSGLDPIVVSTITSRIQLLARVGIGIILTDHKVREALNVVTRAYVINNGVVILSGSAEKIVCNHEVKKVFLGEGFSL